MVAHTDKTQAQIQKRNVSTDSNKETAAQTQTNKSEHRQTGTYVDSLY
jgi:hypothetical protein